MPVRPLPTPAARARKPGLRRAVPAAIAGGLLVATAGCAVDEGRAEAAGPAPDGGSPAATTRAPDPASAFPLTLDNCGFEVTVEEPPERIVTIKSSATEMLLALGLADRIVGTGFPDGPAPEPWTDAAAALPLLAERVPAAEVVLGVEPDLVYAGWESNLTAEGAGDRATLADLGVATYVSPSACKEPAHQPERLTFELVWAEIAEVAALMGVPDAAADLVADQQADLAAITRDDRGLTALWYSSGTDIPYVGAGIGAPQMLMDAVGLTNIADSIADTWSSFSWEEVAAHDPDVIVLVDAAWNSAEQKRELLSTSPATANLSAVRAERYLVVPFAATEAGVRNVPAALDLAAQLAALDL